VSSLLVR